MKIRPILLTALLSALFVVAANHLVAWAASATVPALPTGELCSDVGDLTGLRKDTSIAGTTYYTNTEGAKLESALSIGYPFAAALYDADGLPPTQLSFKQGADVKWTRSISTTNNEWSQVYTITYQVNTIALALPLTHASTHVCLLAPKVAAPPETPTVANTPIVPPTMPPGLEATPTQQAVATPTQEVLPPETPTGLNPGSEPELSVPVTIYTNPHATIVYGCTERHYGGEADASGVFQGYYPPGLTCIVSDGRSACLPLVAGQVTMVFLVPRAFFPLIME